MKYPAFALFLVLALAAFLGRWDWRQSQPDPVQERAEAIVALRHAEELRLLYQQHRDLLIRVNYLQDMTWAGRDPEKAMPEAIEWVDDDIELNENMIQWLKDDLNQAR